MIKGLQITLLIGPGVPIPAPATVINDVDSIEVSSNRERSAFQITFTTGKRSPLLAIMLPAGYLDPIVTRVMIIVTVGGVPNVIMDGVVTQQQVQPSSEPGKSTLTIVGEDLSLYMDLVEMPFMRYPAMPEVAQLYAILAKYAVLGIAPIVLPPIIIDVPNPTEEIPSQTGTDLDYIRQHARRCGYVFYVEPAPVPGANIAYFGPDVRIPVPQPALNVNMDAHTNVEALSFTLEGRAKKIVVMTVLDPVTRKIPIPIPVPEINVFKPPLGLRPTPPARVAFPEELTNLPPGEAVKRAIGIGLASSEAIGASGALDVTRYGHVLRSRMLVGVRGAGLAYDGMYYVDRVSHKIRRGQYKQDFSLSRDGLISQTPMVVP